MYPKIVDNISRIKAEIGGRAQVLGATKNVPPDIVDFVLDNNLLDAVGENRAQEFVQKYKQRHAGKMHFIGRLQTNKAKYINGKAALVHSLDSERLAGFLTGDCLIQLNMGDEAAKGGISADNLFGFAEILQKTRPEISIKGLCGVFPIAEPKVLIPAYKRLNSLFERFKALYPQAAVLSAGMSGDYKIAVEYGGATIVRLGSVLFAT